MPARPGNTHCNDFDLPFDVLQDIFIDCLPRGINVICTSDKYEAPLLFCHICSWWRTVALSTHQLWQGLSFRLEFATIIGKPDTEIYLRPRSLDLFEEWSFRAGGQPLCLRLPFGTRHFLDPVAQFLMPQEWCPAEQLHRLKPNVRHLEVISEGSEGPLIPFHFEESLPNLQSLVIWNAQAKPSAHLAPRLPPAPHLRRIFVRNLLSSYSSNINLFPWIQLSHLVSQCPISYTQWREIIRCCTNLEEGTFSVRPGDFNCQRGLPPLLGETHSFPTIRSLTIKFLGNDDGFTYEDSNGFVNGDHDRFDYILNGFRFPSLKKLQISADYLHDTHCGWAHLLRAAPSLTELHLSLDISLHIRILFGALNVHALELENLVLYDSDVCSHSPEQIIRVEDVVSLVCNRLSSRFHPLKPLKRLVFALPREEDCEEFIRDVSDGLSLAVGEGLDLVLRDDGKAYLGTPPLYDPAV